MCLFPLVTNRLLQFGAVTQLDNQTQAINSKRNFWNQISIGHIRDPSYSQPWLLITQHMATNVAIMLLISFPANATNTQQMVKEIQCHNPSDKFNRTWTAKLTQACIQHKTLVLPLQLRKDNEPHGPDSRTSVQMHSPINMSVTSTGYSLLGVSGYVHHLTWHGDSASQN